MNFGEGSKLSRGRPMAHMKVYRYYRCVAWMDTDAAQVAHVSNYFRYFERAEQELGNELGIDPFGAGTQCKMWPPHVGAHCKYYLTAG